MKIKVVSEILPVDASRRLAGSGTAQNPSPGVLYPIAPEKVTWIVTRRQSDPRWRTGLRFTIASKVQGKVSAWLLVTRMQALPAWISQAGFEDTGLTGEWRNDSTYLVDYEVFKKTCRPGEHVELRASRDSTDYAVFLTASENED